MVLKVLEFEFVIGEVLFAIIFLIAFFLTDPHIHPWAVSFFRADDIIGHILFLCVISNI